MKLYLVESTRMIGYDEYDSMVVIAPDEETAVSIHPRTIIAKKIVKVGADDDSWPQSTKWLKATLLGEAIGTEIEVVCASFNAG